MFEVAKTRPIVCVRAVVYDRGDDRGQNPDTNLYEVQERCDGVKRNTLPVAQASIKIVDLSKRLER
jgi:hypothetical protein